MPSGFPRSLSVSSSVGLWSAGDAQYPLVRHMPGAVHCLWTRCRPVESCCSCTHFPDELTEAGAERLGKAGSQSPS